MNKRETEKKQLRRAISIVLVRVFKHEISNFICWKITGKNATVTGIIATAASASASAFGASAFAVAVAELLLMWNHQRKPYLF